MDLTKKITDHLVAKYHPIAVILHGSRARGMHKENSDWDVFLLVKRKTEVLPEIFEGQGIDVDAVVVPVPDGKIIEKFGSNLRVAKILFDTDGIGADLLARAEKIYEKGKMLDERQYTERKYFVWRRLERLKGYKDEPEVFFVHLGAFFGAALRYWFEVKGRWSEPAYVGLPHIKMEDPDFYGWLEMLWSERQSDEKIAAAEKIYRKLFE